MAQMVPFFFALDRDGLQMPVFKGQQNKKSKNPHEFCRCGILFYMANYAIEICANKS